MISLAIVLACFIACGAELLSQLVKCRQPRCSLIMAALLFGALAIVRAAELTAN
jgi:hypothetical protein